jgi:hypothetical protein
MRDQDMWSFGVLVETIDHGAVVAGRVEPERT